MNARTLFISLFSVVIGFYLAFEATFFSAIHPTIDLLLKILILIVFIAVLILIFKGTIRRQRIIHSIILISILILGIVGSLFININNADTSTKIYKIE